jgi:hypothetical protein
LGSKASTNCLLPETHVVCYSIFLSTDSSRDLSTENSDLLRFEQEAIEEPFRSILQNENRWYVGSKSGCSCTFRHLYSTELGFGGPVDWYPEDEDERKATSSFIKLVRQLVNQGHPVDCVDVWYGAAKDDIKEMEVNLKDVSDEQFRFFENHHFIFANEG